jgi:hypothetical protein
MLIKTIIFQDLWNPLSLVKKINAFKLNLKKILKSFYNFKILTLDEIVKQNKNRKIII